MMRAVRLLVALAVLTLPVQALAGPQVPFKGSDVGGFTLTPGGICASGWFQVDITGAGNATHLGRYAYGAAECFNPTTGAFAGSFTLTAANGDKVAGTYAGQVSATPDPNVVGYVEEAVVAGGTGRFAGATGTLQISGLANLATGEYSQTLSGNLSSPGSVQQ